MDRTPTLTQKFVAELLGTSFLTWIGAGSITAAVFLLNGAKPPLAFTMADLGMIALAFAFAIAAMVYTIGHISGCHINPAVTFSLAVTGHISWNEAVVYWVAQFLGGILGALFIALAFGWTTAAQVTGLGATNFGGAISLYGTTGGWVGGSHCHGDDWHLLPPAGHHGNGCGWSRTCRLGRLYHRLDGRR